MLAWRDPADPAVSGPWGAQEVLTWCYLVLLVGNWLCSGLLGVAWCCVVAWRYLVLLPATWCYSVLIGATWCYLLLLGFTWSYLALIGT